MHVFSKNFRGSPNGWTELEAANFLVGENSTGKSSFGKLLRIIWSLEFQYSNSCVLAEHLASEFSDHFSRISGINSSKKEFTIGYFQNQSDDSDSFGKLVTYIEIDGEICISRMSAFEGKEITSLCFYRRKMRKNTKSNTRLRSCSGRLRNFENQHFSQINSEDWAIIKLPNKDRPPLSVWSLFIQNSEIQEGKKYQVNSRIIDGTGLLRYLGPMRQKPERVYFVGAEREDLEGKGSLNQLKKSFENSSFKKAMNRFGSESGMFDDFEVVDLSRQVQKNAFCLKFKRGGQKYFTDELGFGVSQIIPLLVEMLISNKRPIVLIEQPELHLHPKAQAAFGDLLFEFVKAGSFFCVETHSDFIIDRFRIRCATDKVGIGEDNSSQVLFFDTKVKENVMKKIKISESGSYVDPPALYRNFFLKETLLKFEAL